MIVDAQPLVLCLRNNKKRVQIEVRDEDENLVEASELDLQIQNMSEEVLAEDSFTSPPPGGTRIKNPSTGVYYFKWGDPSAAVNTPDQCETANLGRALFVWSVVGPAGTEEVQRVQTVENVSAPILDMVGSFRNQVDKTRKPIDIDPTTFCPLGYTDGWLLEYLRGGMQMINAYQPYPTWCTLETFPSCFLQTLYDAGMIVAINAQTLFAIDSDVEQWSDQGNAFVINHYPKLTAFNQALAQRLDKIIPQMKLHFVDSGSVKVESGPNFRINALVQMTPQGAIFRNVLMRG
jgi:hypothetical protein